MNRKKREIAILLPVIFLANLFSFVFLGNTQPVYASGPTSPIISGIVVAREDATLIIKDGMARIAVEIPNTVKVKRNNIGASFKDVQVGDHVAISENPDGSLKTMEVVSGNLVQFGKMLIPITFGGITALVLSTVLSRKLHEYAQKFGTIHRQPGITSA